MSMIGTFNRAVSSALNKENPDYKAIFGDTDFVPEIQITQSSDFNCGALCNELEFLRNASEYYVRSFSIDVAEDENLDDLVNAFIDLPRRNHGESDAIFRKRFRTIVNQSLNARRGTKWAILDSLRYFIADVTNSVQVIELFEVSPTYFQLRIEGMVSYEDAIFMNSLNTGFIGQNFIGGEGVGEVISYIGELVDRVKAAGVDYDMLFIKQFRFTKTSITTIGSVQRYKTVMASVLRTNSKTKTINAVVE